MRLALARVVSVRVIHVLVEAPLPLNELRALACGNTDAGAALRAAVLDAAEASAATRPGDADYTVIEIEDGGPASALAPANLTLGADGRPLP